MGQFLQDGENVCFMSAEAGPYIWRCLFLNFDFGNGIRQNPFSSHHFWGENKQQASKNVTMQ